MPIVGAIAYVLVELLPEWTGENVGRDVAYREEDDHAEADVRCGRLLEKLGKSDEAMQHYEEVLASAEMSPRHYRKAQKRWIAEARDAVKRL